LDLQLLVIAYHHYSCECEHCSRRCVLDATVCDEVCQWLAAGWWFSPVSSTNKTGHQDITEILWNGEHHQLNHYNWLLGWVLYFYIHNSMCRYTLINYWLTLTSSSNKPEVAQREEVCTISRACSAILTWIRITWSNYIQK
jgi:hypothetical protein